MGQKDYLVVLKVLQVSNDIGPINIVGGMAIITFTLFVLASFPSTGPIAVAFAYLILVAILLAYGVEGITAILSDTSTFLTGKNTTKVSEENKKRVVNNPIPS